MGSLQGVLLAVMIEEDWLKADDKPYSECAEGLRELDVDSLDKLAEILMRAEDRKEFDRYAPHLKKLFKGWYGWARECYVHEQPPLRPVSSSIGFGEFIGKVMNRQRQSA